MVRTTIMEDLPCEPWLDIFVYLNIRERFDGFFGLNKRINQLLMNHHYYINLKNNDENSQYLFEHILPQLSCPELISSLRLENIKKMNLFKHVNLLRFPLLTSLTLCQVYVTNDILDLLYYNAPHLRYLNMSSFISNKWNTLIQLILSLPKLNTCYLHLGIGLCRIKPSILLASSIQHLTLLGTHQSCSTNSLTSLLNYLPSLRSLHIHCDQLKFSEIVYNHYINKSLSLSSFSLKINHLPDLFIDFIEFISTTMPHLEKLKIKCYHPLRNLVYVNVYQWIKLIDVLTNLKELILIVTLEKTIKEEAWNRRCEQLMKLMKMRQITFQIMKSKENQT